MHGRKSSTTLCFVGLLRMNNSPCFLSRIERLCWKLPISLSFSNPQSFFFVGEGNEAHPLYFEATEMAFANFLQSAEDNVLWSLAVPGFSGLSVELAPD